MANDEKEEEEPLCGIDHPIHRRGSSKKFNKSTIKARHFYEPVNSEEGNAPPSEYDRVDKKNDRHYKLGPADCDGEINFLDSPRKSTSKFVRFEAKETKEENLYDLLIKEWGLKSPTLLISVTGGAKSFDISHRLRRDFVQGLRKVASTPGAWVISGGTDTGVMKMVGEANQGTENTCIGVVTWGVLKHRENLEAQKITTENLSKENPIDEMCVHEYPREGSYLNLPSSESYLDENHTHFLLVDDGTEGNWGVEIEFRNKFEEYIMNSIKDVKDSTPTVLIVVEGGPNTLKTVDLAIRTQTPCVIIKGSGRAADVVAFACQFAERIVGNEDKVEKKKCSRLQDEIRKMNPPNDKQFEELYGMAVNCALHKEIFTIVDVENGWDTEYAILDALLKDTNAKKSLYEKVRFTLVWNRVDLAESILGPLNQWKSDHEDDNKENMTEELEQEPIRKQAQMVRGKEELERLLIMALAMNNVEFVNLLIDYGVSLRSLLTREVLEILYAFRSPGRPSALREFDQGAIDCEQVEHLSQDKRDFFNSISQYLDYNPMSWYCDENDTNVNNEENVYHVHKIDLHRIETHLTGDLLGHVPYTFLKNIIEVPDNPTDKLKHPYRQLFVWAVLNNMREMAIYLWQFVDEAIPTMLLATAITDNMRIMMRSRLHNVQDNEEELLTSSLVTYKELSISLLDTCHKDNEDDTVVLVSNKSKLFSEKCSALDFAFSTHQKEFVAHRAIQDILNDEWYGFIRSNHSQFRILVTVFFPPLIFLGMTIGPPKKGKKVEKISFLKKLKYFYVDSPVVRFTTHTIGYIMFLMLFAYVAMSKKAATSLDSWEILLIVTVAGFAINEVYQMTNVKAPTTWTRVKKYLRDSWNMFDLLCIVTFCIGLGLRCTSEYLEVGHLVYAINVGSWIVRLIQVLYADPFSGPYVVLIGKLFKNFLGFLGILVIVLASYGITVRAILEPGVGTDQMFIGALYKPYFHLFGELFLEDPQSNSTRLGTPKTNYNSYGEPIALLLLGLYLLTANIVLLNLLIAIFSNTYEKVQPNAARIWKFQRYKLILEYSSQRTVLFPPFNLVEHVFLILYYLIKCCTNRCNCCSGASCKRKPLHSKYVLSLKQMKRNIKEDRKKLNQQLFALESKSFNKIMHMRELLETGGIGCGKEVIGVAKEELEKHFIDQQELLERLMNSMKPLNNEEFEMKHGGEENVSGKAKKLSMRRGSNLSRPRIDFAK